MAELPYAHRRDQRQGPWKHVTQSPLALRLIPASESRPHGTTALHGAYETRFAIRKKIDHPVSSHGKRATNPVLLRRLFASKPGFEESILRRPP